ncbi:glycoside hydrolase family 1 protein [Rothia nasimurium]|uniref:Glycoside hydrolase family 1 protein n=1 Tax=Rothia nasimurium TaxID=85336 RepID=A0A4Y9F627_9MICC|nr:glycoside hydrolase family 1 protein [Rothia nasimurium]MBF0808208.1 glycoside hydrolase family 1 protein [Rothia nasimurium]TFU22375.1 glycoside hydrolase family 1 protein [Rothia nasimurium]
MYHKQPKPFPQDFLWSASTSAYQVEGAWDEGGRGPIGADLRADFPEGTSDYKVGADHYHRFKEDVALMAEMGFRAYRFSIAWSRIMPTGRGEVNPEGVQFYHNLIDELLAHKIEPIVTMFHFDTPAALDEIGGWANREVSELFVDYAKVLFTEYGSKVKYWLTINEQNMMILHGAAIGILKTLTDNPAKELNQINHNMFLAQAKTMMLLHQMHPEAKIGPAPNIAYVYPASSRPEDVIAADNYNAVRNWLYLDLAARGEYNSTAWAIMEAKGTQPDIAEGDMEILKAAKPDFIAFNYYATHTMADAPWGEAASDMDAEADQQIAMGEEGFFKAVSNPHLRKTQFGWEIDPVGMRMTYRAIWDRYHLPLIVTENGRGAFDELTEDGRVHDDYRIDYLRQHLEQTQLAISDGVEVLGYSPWSAIDLVSTHQGISKRYGFIYVNRDEFDLKNLARYRKDSFFWYQELIRTNELPSADWKPTYPQS